jgi:hypothetical protein
MRRGSLQDGVRLALTEGATVSSMKFPMCAYGVPAIVVLVAPLLVVSPVLLKIKRKALLEFGSQVTIHNQLFDRKWFRKGKPRMKCSWEIPTHHPIWETASP